MRRIGLIAALMMLVSLLTWPTPPVGAEDGSTSPDIKILETPDGGIQPQAAIDDQGVIHLIYFKGKPGGGDLFYTRRAPAEDRLSPPVRVNSQPGSAIAIGTIRGGQIALGKGGRIHVAWNGSNDALPKNSFGSTPMLYARSDEGGKSFEPQRNLMLRTSVLDGGGTVAADPAGHVYVSWHARAEDAEPGEAGRRMWVARSKDDGATFASEEPALGQQSTGACGCCGTRAMADRHGTVYLLYRAATGGVERGIYLLTSDDRGGHFQAASVHPWKANICPMSSASLSEASSGILAAWETKGQVYFSRLAPGSHEASPPIAPPGGTETASTRPSRATPGARPSWSGPRAPAGKRGAPWSGRSSTDPAARSGPRAGSRAACPSGASPRSSPGPTAGSRSFTDRRPPYQFPPARPRNVRVLRYRDSHRPMLPRSSR